MKNLITSKNEIIPISRGKSAEIIAAAEAFREEKITGSRGEAKSFLSRFASFDESREITQARLYIETMERVLTGGEKLIVDKRINIDDTDLWLFNGILGDSLFTEGKNK